MNKIMKNVWFVFPLINRYSKSRIFISICSVVCNITEMMIFNIIFFPFIIYAISNRYDIKQYYFIGLIIIGLLMIAVMFRMWRDKIYLPQSNLKIHSGFQKTVIEKSKHIDLIALNKSKQYDRYLWVMQEVERQPIGTLNDVFSWIESFIMVLLVGYIMVSLDFIMMVFIVVPIFVNLFSSVYMNKIQYQYLKDKVRTEKSLKYINRTFYLSEFAQEIKTTNIRKVSLKRLASEVQSLKEIICKHGKKLGVISFVETTTINLWSSALAVLYLAYCAIIKQSFSVSEVVVLANSIWQMSSHFLAIFNIIPKLEEHSRYIQDYRDFLAYEPEIKENPEGKAARKTANSLDIKGLYFRYSDDSDYVLKNINMHIPSGKKVAIVGHNGAGKSTLIKLILRLYLPNAGEIQMDGINAGEYKLLSYRERFGTVFQDFQIYAASVEENVNMDISDGTPESEKRVKEALKKSGIWEKISQEKNGIKGIMTKEFDDKGIVLSGGESQKLALARVFNREYGVIILDEPSSALDPISEYKLNQNMMMAAEGKTVIMISHRLSTTKDADQIYYFENGEILEEGTHLDLMKRNGRYAKIFHLQAEAYKTDATELCVL